MDPPLIEVFRLTKFKPDEYYEFAHRTSTEGRYPDERYFTTNKMLYLGRHLKSERWGYGDNGGGAEHFVFGTVTYDYEGLTCFRAVPPPGGGGDC
jgi:hypothetical protein